MFNLEQSIAQWRKRMIATGIKSPVPLEELESHLREDIERQIRAGAEAEHAFVAAAKQMGEGDYLKPEFEKVEGSEEQRRRNRKRIVATFAGTGFAYSVVFATWIFIRRSTHAEITWNEFLLVLGSMVATLLFGLVGRYFARFLPIVFNEWLQAALIVTGIFFGAVLLRLVWAILPLSNLIQAQVVLLWTMSPLLGLANLAGAWCERCFKERKQLNAVNT